MISFDEIELSGELTEQLENLRRQVEEFRAEGELDNVQTAKLEEHFKASHVYHSAGIEGNRLTLQETVVVLQEGLDISGKSLKDSLEVKHLGDAFDFLSSLAASNHTIREIDIRNLHSIVMEGEREALPGEYRKTGVVIAGAEHRPPEPIEVPSRTAALVSWIADNTEQNPVLVSALAHHELAAIHPFIDGNGRVSRLLMNFILMKHGFPICNIRREDRADYYEALSFADVKLFEPLVGLVRQRCADLFAEYLRIRNESKRMAEWAERWGTREAEVLLRRESRERELWQSRMRQVFLEFQRAADLLGDRFAGMEIRFYDYGEEPDLDKYQQLREKGSAERSNVFSINFRDTKTGHRERFMFRYFRDYDRFERRARVIPLELNYFDAEEETWKSMPNVAWGGRVRIRELYFTEDGNFVIRYVDPENGEDARRQKATITEAVEMFFDDVLGNVWGLR
jgi:Fic family protein